MLPKDILCSTVSKKNSTKRTSVKRAKGCNDAPKCYSQLPNKPGSK